MHDSVIRGGTIVDGTGKASFTGDVAISGGRIAAVGGKQGPARREIDATGLLVTPGWVDVHTHYDGQAMWDPLLAPSCWHGVTTVLFGNCGVGFAPVKKEHHGALMDLMEGVEEIPNPVLAAGLTWEWETFPQFMDALERRPRAIDIAAQAAHLPLRVYVMGDRAVRREAATPDDIAEMRRLTIEAMKSGAFGFTTSRTDSHKTPDGELVASRDADADELVGIGSALGAVGMGAFGMNSDFDDEDYELAWMTKLARQTGRPVWYLLTDRYEDPERWKRLLKATHAARAEGLPFTAQIAGRPIGVMMGVGTALNPFTVRSSYKKLESLPIEEQRKRLRDPEVRRQILAEKPSDAEVAKLAQFRQAVTSKWERFYVMGNPPDYEPAPEKSVAAIAARTGRPPDEVAYDYMTEADGQYLYFPVVNYVVGDHAPIYEMLNDPACLLGLSDGGAHCTSIVDAGVPTFMLMHWGRDRQRGPRLLLEHLVKRQTSETADFFGFADRGRLAPGLRADVNLIDFDGLQVQKPELVHDMPAGGRRFVQRVTGYEATLVAGEPIFERGEHTGAMPGRLVRASRDGATLAAAE
ncbi:MAG TPA: amidohydrolase family protein [Xanthobacteraceae bacterium]|jgi:N-acyl-D-aspartate/D-glutamate deacylase|nr:amidohydrolase family protein [Xanthobacteraceae bacterium]